MLRLWTEFREFDGTEQFLYGLAAAATVAFLGALLAKAPKDGRFRQNSQSAFTLIWAALAIRILVVELYSIPSESMVPTLLVRDRLAVSKLSFGWHIPGTQGRVLAFKKPRRGQIVIFAPPHQPKLAYVKRCMGLPGDVVELREKQVFINGQNAENLSSYGYLAEAPDGAIAVIKASYEAFRGRVTPSQKQDPGFHVWLGPYQSAGAFYYLDSRYPQPGALLGRLIDQPAAGRLALMPKGFKNPAPAPGQVDWTGEKGLGNRDDFGPYTLKDGEYWMLGDNRDNSADSRVFGPVRWEAVRGTPLFRYWPPSRIGLIR